MRCVKSSDLCLLRCTSSLNDSNIIKAASLSNSSPIALNSFLDLRERWKLLRSVCDVKKTADDANWVSDDAGWEWKGISSLSRNLKCKKFSFSGLIRKLPHASRNEIRCDCLRSFECSWTPTKENFSKTMMMMMRQPQNKKIKNSTSNDDTSKRANNNKFLSARSSFLLFRVFPKYFLLLSLLLGRITFERL